MVITPKASTSHVILYGLCLEPSSRCAPKSYLLFYLEPGDGGADREAEVERADVAALVDELVRVLLEAEIPEDIGSRARSG